MLCNYCGKEIDETAISRSSSVKYKKQGFGYCSSTCARRIAAKKGWTEERRQKSAEVMRKLNREYHDQIVERMKNNNPMSNPAIREQVSRRLKEIGHHPKIRCGNGCGLTVPQQNLMLALAETLEVYAEYPVPTRMGKGSGYPTCYKVDIAVPSEMIAIEVDGNTHDSLDRQAQDKKKTEFLSGLGWKVLRFRNKQVMEHLPDCVKMVMSTISK